MARTAVTPTVLGPNTSSTVNFAGTTIDSTLVTAGVIIQSTPLEELVLEITQTSSGTPSAIISAGDNPPANASASLTVTFAAGNSTPQEKLIGPFSSSRFIQGGAEAGALLLDFESGFTGTLRALHIPRTA